MTSYSETIYLFDALDVSMTSALAAWPDMCANEIWWGYPRFTRLCGDGFAYRVAQHVDRHRLYADSRDELQTAITDRIVDRILEARSA